jgi:hypothetical protein
MVCVNACKNKHDAFLAECVYCGEKYCPFGDELHFHHDGCPSCWDFLRRTGLEILERENIK